ncbi:MAG: hypothetical protein ABSG53_32765, partial [Thermoguttaceae bacterium]
FGKTIIPRPGPKPIKPEPKPDPQVGKRVRLIVAILLVILSIVFAILAFLPKPPPPPPPPPPTRQELVALAWTANNEKQWDQVVELTTTVISDFEHPADKKQEEYTKQKEPLPKTGRVGVDLSDADEKRNHSFGLVNDVATALFLRGEANLNLGKQVEARADWKKVMTFTHAVTFDKVQKEFWRTSEGAENKLYQLDKKK